MAKFSKYNNPNRRRRKRRSPYSQEYQNQLRDQLYIQLGQAQSEAERDMLIKAYEISVRP